MEEKQDVLIYKNADGNIKLDIHLQNDSVWVKQEQMSKLFGKARSSINEHIGIIYREGELKKTN